MLPGRFQKILKNQATPDQKLGFDDSFCHGRLLQHHMQA
jgi:hypothetical protein